MLWLALDGDGALHRQLYRALREAVLSGRLAPGAPLGSSRGLARELGVSRNTVLQAFEQLIAEGYATPRAGSGTFVADALPRTPEPRRRSEAGPRASEAGALRLSRVGRRIAGEIPTGRATWDLPRAPGCIDFRYGEPAYADLPLETWARLLGRRARRLSVRQLAYQAPGGAAELREAVAEYLARARGVVCNADQLLIVQGSQQAIDLTVRLLVDPGDRVVVEDPGYTGFAWCLTAAGASPVHVPVDAQGLCVEALANVHRASLVCVTPSHQFPTGSVLPLPRRLALLDWAQRRGAWVLEDDYDGEFRYDGRPIPCLQSLDREGRVVYVGTASKILFPALRIGWMVVPPPLADAFRSAKAIADTGTASLEQLALADLIREGHLERHVRRARQRHASRRRALLEALDAHLGERAEVVGTEAGLHVLVRIPELPARAVTRLRQACRERGVGVYSAAPYYASPPARAELVLGYASLTEDEIRRGMRGLRRGLDGVTRASRRS